MGRRGRVRRGLSQDVVKDLDCIAILGQGEIRNQFDDPLRVIAGLLLEWDVVSRAVAAWRPLEAQQVGLFGRQGLPAAVAKVRNYPRT
jgi:hypothetical protein